MVIRTSKELLNLYLCDPVKNTECSKSGCKYNPFAKYRNCMATSKRKFARQDECGRPIKLSALSRNEIPDKLGNGFQNVSRELLERHDGLSC